MAFSLGLERTGGFETVAFCEIEPFPRRVLAKHWPTVPIYEDVRDLTAERLTADGIAVDVICGGFPCQDISIAGLKAGLAGDRSGLWSEISRLAGELRPRHIIVENVANLLSGPSDRPGAWFGRVLGDLAALGFDAEWESIPASALGGHFIGDRVWIVASTPEASGLRWERGWTASVGTDHWGRDEFERLVRLATEHGVPAGSLGRISDGVPDRVDRLKSLGNAVVPQITELIGRAILSAEARPMLEAAE